jgi:hypothetical protein
MDVADMAAFQAVMESEAGAEAMRYDGVHPDTLAVYEESWHAQTRSVRSAAWSKVENARRQSIRP